MQGTVPDATIATIDIMLLSTGSIGPPVNGRANRTSGYSSAYESLGVQFEFPKGVQGNGTLRFMKGSSPPSSSQSSITKCVSLLPGIEYQRNAH